METAFADGRTTGGVVSLSHGLAFRSLLSLGGGTGNAPVISLRPLLITEHHFVSSLNQRAREVEPRSAKL